jgi:hypothetical protein
LFCPTSHYEEELQGKDRARQHGHSSLHIHWGYGAPPEENRQDYGIFFCNDDIERCVKGTKRRWVKSRPDVPNVWPVKIGTNLSRKEILDLERAGFQLPHRTVISPRRLFGMEEPPSDLSSYPIPASPNEHPKIRSGKNIRRIKNVPTTKQANDCASSLTLNG